MIEPSIANVWTPDQLKFQAWLALPSAVREPKSQKQLAHLLEHDPATLSDWKRLPGWHDAVYALAIVHVIGELVPVLHAQVKEAKKGSLPHAQWLFEVAGKWTPKQRTEVSGPNGDPIPFDVQARSYRDGLAPFLPAATDD